MVRIGDISAFLGFANLFLSTAGALQRRQSTLISCLGAASVPVISSDSSYYPDEVLPYNLRVPFLPVAVAVPVTTDHVSSAMICAQRSAFRPGLMRGIIDLLCERNSVKFVTDSLVHRWQILRAIFGRAKVSQ